jgi:anti-sigma regulatory factor (Ser/Thr protein kinase)
MNLLNKVEVYLKRIKLADMIGTNRVYLSVASQKTKLTDDLEARIKIAVQEIIDNLTKILDEDDNGNRERK